MDTTVAALNLRRRLRGGDNIFQDSLSESEIAVLKEVLRRFLQESPRFASLIKDFRVVFDYERLAGGLVRFFNRSGFGINDRADYDYAPLLEACVLAPAYVDYEDLSDIETCVGTLFCSDSFFDEFSAYLEIPEVLSKTERF